MRGKSWAKSSSGLDWVDCETMMRSIGTYHSAFVAVTISPRGTGAGGGVVTDATATFNVLPGSSIPKLVGVKGYWPCPEHSTLAIHVFALLYDLDSAIGKTYKAEALWE